jgi:hypothetical protein
MGQDMRFYIEEENRRELERLRKVEKAAEDLAVIINTDPSRLGVRSRMEVDAYQRLIALLRPSPTSPIPSGEKSNG